MNTNCRLVEEKIGFYLWKQRIDECHKKIRGAIVACGFCFDHVNQSMYLIEGFRGTCTWNKVLNFVYWCHRCEATLVLKGNTEINGFDIDRVTSLDVRKKTQHGGFLEPPTKFDEVFYKCYIDYMSDYNVNSELVFDKIECAEKKEIEFSSGFTTPFSNFMTIIKRVCANFDY